MPFRNRTVRNTLYPTPNVVLIILVIPLDTNPRNAEAGHVRSKRQPSLNLISEVAPLLMNDAASAGD